VSYRNELGNDSNGNLPGQMQPRPQRGVRQSMPDVKRQTFKSGKSGNRLEAGVGGEGGIQPDHHVPGWRPGAGHGEEAVYKAKAFLARAAAHHRKVTGRGRR
jgi:hypothetical protein